jgi:hypothetical protein
MKKVLLTVGLALLLTACESDIVTQEAIRANKKAAIEACIKNDGIPMLDGWGNMTDCKFPPCKKEKP